MKKNFVGHLLIANPTNPDDELSRSVMICMTHTENLSLALQLNRIQPNTNLAIVSKGMGIRYYGDDPIWYGGNISVDKIHIIHSLDWVGINTLKLNKDIGITHDISILSAISQGNGPGFYKACAGYWLFDNGRLDIQLSKIVHPDEPSKWETIPATIENTFNLDTDIMWESCLQDSIIKKVKSYFSY